MEAMFRAEVIRAQTHYGERQELVCPGASLTLPWVAYCQRDQRPAHQGGSGKGDWGQGKPCAK
jgi:hypothetical protein